MKKQTVTYLIWLVIVVAWVAGLSFGRWGPANKTFFGELGRAVGIPGPSSLEWWQPLLYFPLTVVAVFVVSELLFGAVAPLFIFARGVWDSVLFSQLETSIQGLDITAVTGGTIWMIFFYILVFVGNLPLCLWASHLGIERSIRNLERLRGKPLRPEEGLVSGLILLVVISVILGLMAAFAVSYGG